MQTEADGRPIGLALAAWLAMWLASSGDRGLWLSGMGAALVLLVVAGVRRSLYVLAVAAVALSCLLAGGARAWQLAGSELRSLADQRAVGVVEVRIVGGSKTFAASGPRPSLWLGNGEIVRAEARGGAWAGGGRIGLSATGPVGDRWASLPVGTVARATVRWAPPEPDAGLAGLARAREPPRVIAEPGPIDRAVGVLRAGLREAASGLPPEPRGLVPALVVGDTSGIGDDLAERFKVTGLTHLTAVSGANLVLLLSFIRLVAVWSGARGRVLTAVLAVGVAAFVALCLGEPSVIRAAGMGLVGLAALGVGGGAKQGVRYLSVAVWLLVLIDPWLARSWGFALSVAASAGLLAWAGAWTRRLQSWLPGWAAEAVAVPIAAQLATEPLVVALSGRVSLVGILANAVAGPLVGPATVLGFVSAFVSVIAPPIATALASLAGIFAQGLCWVARLGEAAPGASVVWPAGPWLVAGVTVGCVALAVVMPHVLQRRALTLGLFALLVVGLARTPTPSGWPPRQWSVVVCDVGQGDATVLNAGGGAAVLVDAGPDVRALERCLAQLGVRRVPLAVLTHGHSDHVTGLPALASRGPTTLVRHAPVGTRWRVGDADVAVLAGPAEPAKDVVAESSDENDTSLLLRGESGGVSVVLAGDAGEIGQGRHLGLGDGLDVDVLLVPHHGSADQSEPFLALTRPQVAVVSVGADNDYGHPTVKTLARVQRLGAHVARTDRQGSVAVARVNGRLEVTTQR